MPTRPPVHRPAGWKPTAQRRAEFDQQRGTAASRGYDADWRKLRAVFLRAYPACVVCGQAATDADHILSVRERPDLRLQWSNLRPMCHAHHSARTARDHSWHRR